MTAQRRHPSAQRPSSLIPAIIIAAGIALTFWIQTFSQNGVVFSGDGGLKALVAQQLAEQLKTGNFPLDIALNLPAADWVKTVWSEGLYPFSPPFVYEVGPQYFITFPFTFPLLSAPFYALFGDRGLYIIPIISLWAIWFRFWQLGKRASWSTLATCIGLVTLIFASPLSLYSGMYWEHTLATALAFWGLSDLIFPPSFPLVKSLSRPLVLRSGILIGLAVWFRPEFLCLIAALSLMAGFGWLLPKWRIAPPFTLAEACIFIGAMACTVGVFFALNYAIYGHPLGIHAIQIVEESSPANQIAQAKAGYQSMGQLLQRYFPIVWVVGLAAVFSPELKGARVKASPFKSKQKQQSPDYFKSLGIRKPSEIDPTPRRFALLVSLLFALSVPLIVPPGAGGKQWGPRFYLILVPLLSTVLAEQFRPLLFRSWAKRLLLLATALVLFFSIHLNTVNGAFRTFKDGSNTSLLSNYEPVAPAIQGLQQQPNPWIAMSHEFVAQQLWSALPGKTFFLTETVDDVKQLATALQAQNESEFLYVCYPHRECLVPETATGELGLADGSGTLSIEFIDTYGKYPVYKVEISA